MSLLRLFSTEFSAEFDGLWPLPTTGARPHFAFPFWLGAENPVISVVTTPPRWGHLSQPAHPWQAHGGNQNRFERLYAQPALTFGTRVNFIHRIQTTFPTRVLTGGNVLISSTITNP